MTNHSPFRFLSNTLLIVFLFSLLIFISYQTYQVGIDYGKMHLPKVKFQQQKTTSSPSAQMINPASANCIKMGGTLGIQKNGAGNEYGICEFSDARACEEWALFRGDCPKGGIKTTGLDTPAQKYCAWLGGKTLASAHATCTFTSGNVCDDDKLYNGTCSPSK